MDYQKTSIRVKAVLTVCVKHDDNIINLGIYSFQYFINIIVIFSFGQVLKMKLLNCVNLSCLFLRAVSVTTQRPTVSGYTDAGY